MRIIEAVRLRIQDIDFKMKQITVRSGKGDKDRITTFPGSIKREECDEYEYTIVDTGEVINLKHRWIYVDNVEEVAEQVLVDAAVVI